MAARSLPSDGGGGWLWSEEDRRGRGMGVGGVRILGMVVWGAV